MNRFFKASDNIVDLSKDEITAFLQKEKILNRVNKERVHDFFRALSTSDIHLEESIDYGLFNCKTEEDKQKIDVVRDREVEFLSKINPDLISGNRLLKAATALAYKFEKDFDSEEGSDVNAYLRNLFNYHEDKEGVPEKSFGELMEADLDYLRYLSLLSKKKAFQGTKSKLVRSEEGKKFKYAPLESISDVMSCDKVDMVLPGFSRKLIEKDLYVRTKFRNEESSQNLIILVDNSGSMRQYNKRSMLKAAIDLKIKYLSEANNIYITTFVGNTNYFHKLKEGETMDDLKFITLNGGGTDVNGSVKETIKAIKERKLKGHGETHELSEAHFEILVINDGEDEVDKSFHPDIKLHVLCLKKNNIDLKNICHRSGGTYIHLQ